MILESETFSLQIRHVYRRLSLLCLKEPHTSSWAEKIYILAQNTDKTVTRLELLANGWEARWSFIRENRKKNEEPSWGTSDNGATRAPWQLCKVHT